MAWVHFKQLRIVRARTFKVANLRRLKYALSSEKFCAGMSAEQKSLLEETLDSDLAELDVEIERERGEAGDKARVERTLSTDAPEVLAYLEGQVPQDGFLFTASVGDNVRYARPGATDAQVRAAFTDLGLADWLADPLHHLRE